MSCGQPDGFRDTEPTDDVSFPESLTPDDWDDLYLASQPGGLEPIVFEAGPTK